MEIAIGIAFVAIIAFVGIRKFKKASEGKDCCK